MKFQIHPHNPIWKTQFNNIKTELQKILNDSTYKIEHIGSTSVKDLAAKPIIDIMIGVHDDQLLDAVVSPLVDNEYVYYEKYNAIMPTRRFFIKLKKDADPTLFKKIYGANDDLPHAEMNGRRLAHIHVWNYHSKDWLRHIAFRDFLRTHEEERNAYQELKLHLSKYDWKDGNEYNDEKNDFIKDLEAKAVNWYNV